MRLKLLTVTLALTLAGPVACKKKDKGGGDNPPPPGGDGGGDGGDGGGGNSDFNFAEAGVLAVSFGDTSGGLGGANLSNYQPVAPPVPAIAPAVESATPGQVLISTALQPLEAISCTGVDSANHAHWFACKAINDGTQGYPYVLEEVDSRLNRIKDVGTNGALCFETARSTITITENGLSIPQELSCWDEFGDNSGEGLAFGYSDSKVWMRLSDGYGIATVDINDQGAATAVDAWSISDENNKSSLLRVKSNGTSSVEITAVGDNLNAHYQKGVQVLLDNANDMMYMRYICDNPVVSGGGDICGGDGVYKEFCTDLSDNDLTDSDACPGSIPWTLPMLVLDDSVGGLPVVLIELTQAGIPGIGSGTDAALRALMSLRIPAPLATLRNTIFGTSSSSLNELLKSVDSDLAKVEGWVTNDPAQCLVEVPKVLDITSPVDLDLPLLVSCQPNDDKGWTVYGKANGSTTYANKYDNDKSGTVVSFDADGNMNAWVVRPYADEEMVYRIAVGADGTAELTGMQKGGEIECGIHYKTNGTNFFMRSTLDKSKCASGAPATGDYLERCVSVADLKYQSLETCRNAGLDIFTLSPVTPQAIAYNQVASIMPASPALGTSNEPVNTTAVPPIATIPLPESGDGKLDVVPVRSRNVLIPKASGGGVNYGRNCKHTAPVGNPTANGVYELALSELSAEQLTALQSQVGSNNAFVSFNFSEDILNIGTGATVARDLTFKVSLVDTNGTEIISKTFANADLSVGAFVTYSMLTGQTLDATQKVRAELTGSASVTCAGNSGQGHISAGISDLRLRF